MNAYLHLHKVLFSIIFSAAVYTSLGTAQAATESFTTTTSPATVTTLSQLVQTSSLPAFNSTLGVLTGVEFTLTLTDTPSVDIYNFTSVDQPYDFGDFAANLSDQSNNNYAASVPAYTDFTGTASPGLNQFAGSEEMTSQITDILPANFSLYEGMTGTTFPVSFTYTETNSSIVGSNAGPGVFFGGHVDASSSLTVKYTYESIPEPSAWMMILIGMAVLYASRGLVQRSFTRS